MNEPAYINDPDAIVWAAGDGDIDLIVRLVNAGAEVNIKSDDGRSALHMAAEDDWSHIAEFLLSHGADPNITDADGDTPHDYAVFHDHSNFAALLVSRGATIREGQSAKQRLQEALDKDLDTVRAFHIENYFAEFQKNKETYYQEALERFPKPGAKLRYRGTNQLWYTNIIANAERELKIGTTYTLRTIQLFSSWALITLEETGDIEFALGFFDDLSRCRN
jgi:hypothetical protein